MLKSGFSSGAKVILCISVFGNAPSFAQEITGENPQEFEKPDVQALQQQINDLKAKVDQLEENDIDIDQNSDDKDDQNAQDFFLEWDPGPKLSSKDGQFSFQLNGRVTYDYANITFKDGAGDTRPGEKVDGMDLRYLDFGFRGKMFGNFNYRVVMKFNGGETELKMATFDYNINNTKIIFGQTRTYTTLDKMTPPTMMAFAERFAFVNAINVDRRIGIAAAQHGDDWSVSGGYFFQNAIGQPNDGSNMISGRANYSPQFESGLGVHIGASAFYRNRNGNPYDPEYEKRAFSKQGDVKPLFSGDFLVDNELFIGGEFAANYGSFGVQTEYATIKTDLNPVEKRTMTNPRYEGGYVEVGFFPTGGSQNIDGSDGRLNDVKVNSPVGNGGIGEIRLAVRYDIADLRHETFGRKQTSYIGAVDWYLNEALKIQMNYAHSVVRDYMNVKTDTVNTFNTRFMFNF